MARRLAGQGPRPISASVTANYPNMYQLVGPHTALGPQLHHLHDRGAGGLRHQLHAHAGEHKGADYLEVKPAAQDQFNGRIQRALKGTVWSLGLQELVPAGRRPSTSRSGPTRPGATGSRRARLMRPSIGSGTRREAWSPSRRLDRPESRQQRSPPAWPVTRTRRSGKSPCIPAPGTVRQSSGTPGPRKEGVGAPDVFGVAGPPLADIPLEQGHARDSQQQHAHERRADQ